MTTDSHTIIAAYYGAEDTQLKHILLTHSRAVAQKALAVVRAHPELHLDAAFVETAAMLHDIGIVGCHAPAIACMGTAPYICHGLIGANMLRQWGRAHGQDMEPYARVCERHTGTGLTRRDIETQQLPLPCQDFMPETVAEQVICYADKFYSKTHLDREKTVEQALKSLAKFGDEGLQRFSRWHQLFGQH